MKSIRISAAIIIFAAVCSIFACKKDDQKQKETEPPTGIEGIWNGTLNSGVTTWNTIGVFTSNTLKIYKVYQQATANQPNWTGTYKTIGDSISCTMATGASSFVPKDTGFWHKAGNNNGLSYPASMSFPTLDPIYGYWELTKE